jgi:hypothetical protein
MAVESIQYMLVQFLVNIIEKLLFVCVTQRLLLVERRKSPVLFLLIYCMYSRMQLREKKYDPISGKAIDLISLHGKLGKNY